MPLLEGRSLSKHYEIPSDRWRQNHRVNALQDVSFQLHHAETLAVAGGSGSGKSTLARLVSRLLPPDQGDVLYDGTPANRYTAKEWGRRVQMVFQDPYASLNPKLTVGTQLSEMLRMVAPKGEIQAKAIWALEAVGLSADALQRYPFQFSGGQRQRIAIARALTLNPQIVVADEPLSALDIGTQDQILDLFRMLQAKRGLAFLFITHDLMLVERLAHRVMILKEGHCVEAGPAAQVLKSPQHAYTQALVEAVPR